MQASVDDDDDVGDDDDDDSDDDDDDEDGDVMAIVMMMMMRRLPQTRCLLSLAQGTRYGGYGYIQSNGETRVLNPICWMRWQAKW